MAQLRSGGVGLHPLSASRWHVAQVLAPVDVPGSAVIFLIIWKGIWKYASQPSLSVCVAFWCSEASAGGGGEWPDLARRPPHLCHCPTPVPPTPTPAVRARGLYPETSLSWSSEPWGRFCSVTVRRGVWGGRPLHLGGRQTEPRVLPGSSL